MQGPECPDYWKDFLPVTRKPHESEGALSSLTLVTLERKNSDK